MEWKMTHPKSVKSHGSKCMTYHYSSLVKRAHYGLSNSPPPPPPQLPYWKSTHLCSASIRSREFSLAWGCSETGLHTLQTANYTAAQWFTLVWTIDPMLTITFSDARTCSALVFSKWSDIFKIWSDIVFLAYAWNQLWYFHQTWVSIIGLILQRSKCTY